MSEEERDVLIKTLLLEWTPEDLEDLRSDCVEIANAYHLGNCAQRLHQIAEHELRDHHCAGSALYLKAIAERLEWFHRKAMALGPLPDATEKMGTIH